MFKPFLRNASSRTAFFLTVVILSATWFESMWAAPSLNCGDWKVDVKSGTYDSSDSIWWNGTVRFTNQWGTYSQSWSTSSLPSASCIVNTDGDTCSVTLSKNGHSVSCESPKLRLDTTPPTCGNWDISTNSIGSVTWSPGQDIGILQWYWNPFGRNFTVHISDGQSGVPNATESFDWPSDSLSGPSMQSSLGDLARITVADNAGNSTECVWPRKRVDGFEPNMPTLNCDNFISGTRPLSNPYQGEVKCGMSDSAGPSKNYSYYRIQTYFANATTGAIGAMESDTNWVPNGSFDTLFDANGNRVKTGVDYETNSAPLRYAFIPKDNRITRISGRLCEFVGTAGSRCTDSNVFEIIKLPPPPPIPETAGDGWYDCQDPNTGKLIWYAPDESIEGMNQTLTFACIPDGIGTWEPKSKAKISGTIAAAGSAGCWCWDNESPTISSITATPSTWTNQPVSFVGIAGATNAGGSPYGGIQFSCDNGATWSTGTTATTANFTCDTVSAGAQTAKVRACDLAKNCSAAASASFFIEKTAPSIGSFTITGKKKSWNGHSLTAGETDSTLYTYKKDVTLGFSTSDSGGSGLNALRFSCDPTYQDSGWESWSSGTSKAFDLTDSSYGCGASEGVKTVYVWAKDHAGNVSARASSSISYDKTAPTFDTYSTPILLRATANYTYSAQNPNDGAGSGLKDYSYTWISEMGGASTFFNLASASNNFGDLARYVNSSCDVDDDGKCIATIRITVEDNAGNATTKEQRVEIISNTIAVITGDVSLTSSRLASAMVGDLYDRYTYTIHLEDANGNVIRPVPGILEIRGDWAFANDASFLGNENPSPNGNITDGAVWYNWDDGNWVSSSAGNSASRVYVGSNTRPDGTYTIQVRSAVPTKQGYADLTRNQIKVSMLQFTNALASADASGCPSGYVCNGQNSNPGYGRSLGADLATDANVNGYLAFKPALEVIPTKSWNDLTDSTWHDVGITFKNNSSRHSFSPVKYGFDFHYDTYLGNFADMSIKGDLGTYSALGEGSLNKISFFLASGLSSVPAGGSTTKTISVRANSHGIGFGKIGFTWYLPWLFENNAICDVANCSAPVATTGYNTANLGMASGIMAFDFLAVPVPSAGFGSTQSYGQKFAANGQIADSGRNRAQAIESGVAIDTATVDKTQFKTSVRKNVETMTRWLASDNGSNCAVTLSSFDKDLYYYDFSGLSATPVNWNRGCVLKLQGGAVASASGYRKLGITGKKTVIVRGGNVLIDSDLYYGNSNSMLALVVLRDDADRTKGGNVLVADKVTNVVASGYAEGSLISYEPSSGKVYDIGNTSEGELTRQLLWYGSLFSANTIGGSMNSTSAWECPYGSDTYEATKSKSCSETEASRYDFALLRRFLLINADSPLVCAVPGKKAPKSTGTSAETYAIAGKKRCFQSDANDVAELRSTTKTASFVMEYNPFMPTSGMKIFSK